MDGIGASFRGGATGVGAVEQGASVGGARASAMQLTICGTEFYLDGLVLECILSSFRANELARLSAVCRALRSPSQLAAHRTLLRIVRQLQASLLRHHDRGSWIRQLADWEDVVATNFMWIQADPAHTTLVKQDDVQLVRRATDMSGRANSAHMHKRMPILRPNAVNGHAAFEFDGASVLKTRPFKQPVPQPVTMMIIARARGDTTIVDSLGPQCVASSPPGAPRLASPRLGRCTPPLGNDCFLHARCPYIR